MSFYFGNLGIITFTAVNIHDTNAGLLKKPVYKSGATAEAFTIYIPGKQYPDGSSAPGKVCRIPKLDKEHYYPNMIHIKTINDNEISKDNRSLSSSSYLSAALMKYEVEEIRAPFEVFSRGALKIQDKENISRIFEVRYKADIDPYEVCKELMARNEIEYAVPVFIDKISEHVPNDPRLGSQWLINKIKLKDAWEISKGDKEVLIAIVDSGVDYDHEDLADNIWTNPNEIPDNKIDDDGNGKADDVRGWDLVGNISANQAMYGQWMEDNNPKNIKGTHGTHVAGCATAVTNNGIGVAGPGYNCSIIPVKCGLDAGGTSVYRGYEGIVYAASVGADIINCSWSGPGYSPVAQDIINQVTEMGSLVVVAAGNDGANLEVATEYPAGYDNVLCVGATTKYDKVANFSNYGNQVTVYSPGASILSTMPSNSYKNQDGTSMASPVTAGVAGLVKAIHKNWEPLKILQQIRSSSDNIFATSDPSQRARFYGRLNAYNAVSYNKGTGKPVPGITVSQIKFIQGSSIDTYDSKQISLKVTNYLSTANNVTMKIESLDGILDLSQTEINLGNLTTDQEKSINLFIELTPRNPWYLGTTSLMVTFESGDYINYQRINLPITLESDNEYTLFQSIPLDYMPYWHSAVSTGSSNIWALGQGALFNYGWGVYWQSGLNAAIRVANTTYPFYCIDAIDANTAYAGGGNQNGSQNEVYKTTNGGQSWTGVDVTSITNFINGINFYDESNAIFLGDPANGKWGIGISDDGGATWSNELNSPAPLSGEMGWAGSYDFLDHSAWFGTNMGQIYRTSDRGKNWTASKIDGAVNISLIGFMDEEFGLAVYTKSADQGVPKYLARTYDGGGTWEADVFALNDDAIYPVYLFTAEESGMIYLLCNAGEILGTNDGKKFTPILSEKHGTVLNGTTSNFDLGKIVLWNIGREISTLSFDYDPLNGKRELVPSEASSYDFDSVAIGEKKTIQVPFVNNGNIPVNIYEYKIEPGDGVEESEFALSGIQPKTINPGSEFDIRVIFRPEKPGKRTARFVIRSNNGEGNVVVTLEGFGYQGTGIEEIAVSGDYKLYRNSPNPCKDKTVFAYETPESGKMKIELVDYNGKILNTLFNGIKADGHHTLELNASELLNGAYFLRITAEEHVLIRKFVVQK